MSEVEEKTTLSDPIVEEPSASPLADTEASKKPAGGDKKLKNPRIDRMKTDNGGKGKGGNGGTVRRRTESWSQKDLQLSRCLAGILRHGMMGFETDDAGFLYLDDILKHHHFKQLNVNYDDLKR